MPPTFDYIGIFMVLSATVVASFIVPVTTVGLTVSLFPPARIVGCWVAIGAALSLPGILFFQMIGIQLLFSVSASPILNLVFLALGEWVHQTASQLRQPVSMSLLAAASVYGIYFGYRAAWTICTGSPWHNALKSDHFFSWIFRSLPPDSSIRPVPSA